MLWVRFFLRKLDFAENGNLGKKGPILCKKVIFLNIWDIFIFPNVCAIQINLGSKDFLGKTVLENMGYWQNGLEFEKVMLPYGDAAWIRVNVIHGQSILLIFREVLSLENAL